MKMLFAATLMAAAAFGQLRAPARPLGGVPGSSPVISRPLGGAAFPTFPAFPSNANKPISRRPPRGNARYVGPIFYIPNAFDFSYDAYQSPAYAYQSPGYYDSTGYPPPGYQSAGAPPAQPAPVIVNQYFTQPSPAVAPPPAEPSAAHPGDLLAEPQNYYLIQYKDHTIYTALTYWLEGDTLHYVTTQNTHNQASLSLIDLDKTYKLNEDRSVPFSLPGK